MDSSTFCTDRGVYNVTQTSGMSTEQVLTALRDLEAKAFTETGSKMHGGLGGSKFRIANII